MSSAPHCPDTYPVVAAPATCRHPAGGAQARRVVGGAATRLGPHQPRRPRAGHRHHRHDHRRHDAQRRRQNDSRRAHPRQQGMEAHRAARLRPHLHDDDRRPRARRHAVPSDVQLHHRESRLPGRGLPRHGRRHPNPGGRHVRRRHRRGALRRTDQQQGGRRTAPRRHHHPPVHGSWYWLDDQTAHWRPEKYYAPGTSVTVSANIYGAPLGDGVYGQEDEHVSFKIGDSHVSIADDTTKQVSVYENGKLVRTMPTSMGMGGTEHRRHHLLLDPPGVYTVMDKANPVIMDSSTFGFADQLPPRLSRDHSLRHPDQHRRHLPPPAQRHCMGAGQHHHLTRLPESQRREREMVLGFSMPGDVVEGRNTGGQPLQLSQNGDWSVPWDQWRHGSKLS